MVVVPLLVERLKLQERRVELKDSRSPRQTKPQSVSVELQIISSKIRRCDCLETFSLVQSLGLFSDWILLPCRMASDLSSQSS